MLGTYKIYEKDETVEVSFFPWTSCGTAYIPPIDIQTTGNQPSTVTNSLFPIIIPKPTGFFQY